MHSTHIPTYTPCTLHAHTWHIPTLLIPHTYASYTHTGTHMHTACFLLSVFNRELAKEAEENEYLDQELRATTSATTPPQQPALPLCGNRFLFILLLFGPHRETSLQPTESTGPSIHSHAPSHLTPITEQDQGECRNQEQEESGCRAGPGFQTCFTHAV